MDLHGPLFRAYAMLRLILVVLAIVINLFRINEVAHPVALIVMCVVMLLVSIGASILYALPEQRKLWVFLVDMIISIGVVLCSLWVLGPQLTTTGASPSIGVYWAVGAPLAVALWRGWVWGALAGVLIMIAEFVVAPELTPGSVIDKFLILLACVSVGYFTSMLRATTHEREQMYAVAAGMAERQRLARIVHDGVLQVLAMVEREGRVLGPRGMRLARAAHEQEGQLRALLQDTDIDVTAPDSLDVTHHNLSVILDKHSMPGVTISTPAGTILVESGRAREIDAAVAEALTNVSKHAGPQAQAWVLLEREGDEIVISIRDNGVGGTLTQFGDAVDRGRMGMRHSIHGRLADLGGTARVRTAPGQGVEWEFRIPVDVT
ncbi:MacS family sensor histidine kinase [Propionibacteriaceae bacterium Y1685]